MNDRLQQVAALTALILLVPILALIGLIVGLTSSGGVFYTAPRVGRDRLEFRQIKFRTMIKNADDLVAEDGIALVSDVPRITAVGRIMRPLGLDELPQLLNIIRGDMVFVGPRPLLPAIAARVGDEYGPRYLVRPGITGLAQVRGRNSLSWTERLTLDCEYVENRSFLGDVKLLLETAKSVVTRSGFEQDRTAGHVDI